MTCTSSPWAGFTSANPAPPSTILLPIGTIGTNVTWILPANTRLIGAGDNMASGTVIQATGPLATPSPMIQLGSSSLCSSPCTGISVENLTLDGGGNGRIVHGILNRYSTTNTFVDHVGLYRILGTGLWIASQADGSGPA